jgi:DNA-binding NarL/FixJ family response regulator
MPKILVADSYNIHRIGLVQLLHDAFPGALVHEVNDADTLFTKMSAGSWDLIISGFISPLDTGINIIKRIKANSRISVAVCGIDVPPSKIDCLLHAGADMFIDKGAKASLIAAQVEKLLAAR